MKLKRIILVVVTALVVSAMWLGTASSRQRGGGQEIYVAAAASMANALERLAKDFENSRGIRVRLVLASSGLLRKKIEAGARVDAFISASTRDMDLLESSGYVMPETRKDLLRNTLVCVVEASSGLRIVKPADLLKDEVRRIAIGDPSHVPAGIYAKQALMHLGLWERLRGKFVPCIDARACVGQVKAGGVAVAIVYGSDVMSGDTIEVAFDFPPPTHAGIVYPVCILADAPHAENARAFLDFLTSTHAAAVFAEQGFESIRKEVK
ncbi:hypothetical protein LCGC14_2608330 [marine sediment metagenome]|uniref:Molybdate ABC transporter substrate-binding protein n=1 Tax=marine sediment metagenome TaxID=412755 RepID=A0A0F9A6Y4_9ZZZZ